MNEISPTIPKALLGVDVNRFAKEDITLDPSKTFDENLKANFGISADQAAEIINYALINDIPLTPTPAVALTSGDAMTGGSLQQIITLVATILAAVQNGQQLVNYVGSSVALIDSASQSFIESSALATTARVWREEMSKHCPEVVSPPVACSYLDLHCKLIDYDRIATEKALYEYNSELCSLATKKYTTAVIAIPEAQRRKIEQGAKSLSGIVTIANTAAIPTEDMKRLIKDKILDSSGKVLDEGGYKAYVIDKLTPAPVVAAAAAAVPGNADAAAPSEAEAKKGGRRRKTGKKSKGKKRGTFRRPKFVY